MFKFKLNIVRAEGIQHIKYLKEMNQDVFLPHDGAERKN